jgi:hypothetical protein
MTHFPKENTISRTELEQARIITSFFDIPEPFEAHDFSGKGNINRRTYLISAGGSNSATQYLLQQLNPVVFAQPHAVMDAMVSCINAQKKALLDGIVHDEEWEIMQLIPTRSGKPYLERPGTSGTECWRMMIRIGNALVFRSLREIADPSIRIRVAEEAGRGLAIFGALTAGMDASQIGCPLPGYRDTELYYNQLISVLADARIRSESEAYLPSDPFVREMTEQHFLVHADRAEYRRRREDPVLRRAVGLALEQKSFGLMLSTKMKSGELKKVVVHGDTKLDNFLFSSSTGRVKALVDLDTIMPHTWLSDWGDMARSLVNIAGERETDLEKIQVDENIFLALASGFLSSARHLDSREVELMVDAAEILALELGVRFLTDYLRGDSYFKLEPGEPPDLNKTRAIVQFCLFERLRSKHDLLKKIIESNYR